MKPHHFLPKIQVSGLTISIAECEYSSAEHDVDGKVEASSLSFTETDAGKHFCVSLVRGGGGGPVAYQLLVQAPEVQAPLVPELSGANVLFPFMSGTVSQDGKSLQYSVRQFGRK